MSTTADAVADRDAGSPSGQPPASRPSALLTGLRRVRLELLQFSRDRMGVVFIFAYPVAMMLIFGSVVGDQQVGAGVSFAQYFLPGILATGVMLSSFQNLALSIADERDVGLLKRLRGTPMPPASYLIGKIGQVLVVVSVQTVLTLATAVLTFDATLPATPGLWLTFAWVYLLGVVAGSVMGIGISSLPRSGQEAGAVVTPLVIILQFVSGVFFVFSDLPRWMQRVAELFPLAWLARGMRSVFLPDAAQQLEVGASWQHPMTAAVLLIWVVAGLVLTLRTFRWTRRDAG